MKAYSDTTLEALRLVFGDAYGRTIGVRLWDGTRVTGSSERCILIINEPGALRAAFRAPLDLNAGRAFVAGLIGCDGDVEYAVGALVHAVGRIKALRAAKLILLLRRLPPLSIPHVREAQLHGKVHSRARDREAITFHYDQPLPFYAAFLDRRLVYSCAYYDEGIEDLDGAQLAKLDHVLRKLRLAAGDRLLDIGCGWGALVIRAAEHYGANALGITLSRSQFEEGNRRIAEAGLGGRARIELRDYRDLGRQQFDRIASIGMFEHVGRANLSRYFQSTYKALRPGGLFLNHGIAEEHESSTKRIDGFMESFVFPDGELVQISAALEVAQRCGFEVRDVENLREHYTKTLRAWEHNLEEHRDAAIAVCGEQSYRVWRLYMAGSAQGFNSGRIAIYQSLLARPDSDGSVEIPPTRRDLYQK
jgi:cyclopropane-fatty-acyl-phospholipid synthase